MAANKKKSTVEIAEELIKPVLEGLGLKLWDARFEKEGTTWYLRYFIDKVGGVNINDCETVSRAVDKLLDVTDPIEQSYILEVSSPGVEREITRDWHYVQCAGQTVQVRLIRPVEGVRDFMGELAGKKGGEITILLEGDIEMTFLKSEAAFVKLYVDFNGGLE